VVEAGPEISAQPQPDNLLGDRYRLVRPVPTEDKHPPALWVGEDLVLARRVAVRLLRGRSVALREAFLAAAADAGRVVDSKLASVYDAALATDEKGRPVAYVVTEWVDGRPLDAVLREAPLAPDVAAAVTKAVAEAVVALHEQGLTHGRLHPGNVLLTPGGRRRGGPTVKVTDAVVGAALAAGAAGAPGRPADPVAADTAALGRLLYACLTGRWPTKPEPRGTSLPGVAPWAGLPPAPTPGGRLRLPRQIRAGLPRAADSVCTRTLDPGGRPDERPLRTPAAFLAALRPLLDAVAVDFADKGEEEENRPVPLFRRGPARWALRLGLLAALAGLGWVLGLVVGRVPGPPSSAKAPTVTVTASGGAQVQPIDLSALPIRAFDPQGSPPVENDQAVPQAYDKDPTTGWQTEIYYGGAKFGGLKSGVGLLVDLGSPRSLREVDLTLAGQGDTTVELRAAPPTATTAPAAADGYQTTATQTGSSGVQLKPKAGTSSRFWLVWLTSLPRAAQPQGGQGDGWQGEIDEMVFLPA
jgi:hypothetical protein